MVMLASVSWAESKFVTLLVGIPNALITEKMEYLNENDDNDDDDDVIIIDVMIIHH